MVLRTSLSFCVTLTDTMSVVMIDLSGSFRFHWPDLSPPRSKTCAQMLRGGYPRWIPAWIPARKECSGTMGDVHGQPAGQVA